MVTEQEIWDILTDFNSIKPVDFLQQLDVASMGIGNVLGFLASSKREVTAGEISEYMGVSTARVAVLLKKMSEKGLIEKHADPKDARRVMVSITDEGMHLLIDKRKEILLYAGAIIDRFGKDIIISSVDEDHFRTTVNVSLSSQFLGWIMGLGGKVKITGPSEVVDMMKSELKILSEQYNEN